MEAAEEILPVSVNTSCGESLVFNGRQELQEFVDAELYAYRWLEAVEMSISSILLNQIRLNFSKIQEYMAGEFNRGNQALMDALTTAYVAHRMPVSTSRIGQFVSRQAVADPADGALRLAAWMMPGLLNFAEYSNFRAAVAVISFDLTIYPETASEVEKSLQSLVKRFSNSRARAATDAAAQVEAGKVAEKVRSRTFSTYRKLAERAAKRFQVKKGREISAAIEDIRLTERLYKEQMRLQAPVDYWSAKAASHKDNSMSYRWSLILFAACGSATIILTLLLVVKYVLIFVEGKVDPFVYVPLATLGIVVATIVFWVARILTRLFLSEHHLSIDAEERAVMAKTYLALTAEGKVSDTDRALVLSALFRPTADGIVKDDAAPDLTPAALASKVLAR